MAKNKKKNIVTLGVDELEDFIWMSYRYCIGRHTIAANYHASTIAKYVDNLTPARKLFMAKDIRREVSDCLHYRSNFQVDGYSEKTDAVSAWLRWLKKDNIVVNDEFMKTSKFIINTDTDTVAVDTIELGDNRYDYAYNTINSDIHDLLVWIKLANYLDTKTHRTVLINGEEKEAFPYYSFDQGIVDELWITCDYYLNNPMINSYIASDNLKFKE